MVEGGAIPHRTVYQTVMMLPMVQLQELQSIPESMLSLFSLRRNENRYLAVVVMVSLLQAPGQVQVPLGFKVNPDEPEAAEALLRSPIDGWVGPRLLRLFSWRKDQGRAQQ